MGFVDDDDLWAPEKLAAQLEAAEGEGRDWAYAGSVNVNERLEIIHGASPPTPDRVVASVRRTNPIPASASNVMIHRDVFAAAGGFREELRACEEWDLWIRLTAEGPPAWVPEPLVAYRMHPGNAILDVEGLLAGARRLEELHGIKIDRGHFHRWIAQLCLRGGRRGDALAQYGRAVLHGGGRAATSDLARAARRSLRRQLGRPEPRSSASDWVERARPWIEKLRRLEAATKDEAR